MHTTNRVPQVPTAQPADLSAPLPAEFSLVLPSGEVIRHLLLGSPAAVRQTVHLLHNLRYVETSQWSPLIEIPERRLVLSADQGEVLSLLARRL